MTNSPILHDAALHTYYSETMQCPLMRRSSSYFFEWYGDNLQVVGNTGSTLMTLSSTEKPT